MPKFKTIVRMRWMAECDYPAVSKIEKTAYPKDPMSVDDISEGINRERWIGLVGIDEKDWPENRQKPIAYVIYKIRETWLEIRRIAVAPDFVRHGIGTQMAAGVAMRMSQHSSRTHIDAHIDEYNLPQQLFFKALGFRCVYSTIRNGDMDAIDLVMRMDFPPMNADTIQHRNRLNAYLKFMKENEGKGKL